MKRATSGADGSRRKPRLAGWLGAAFGGALLVWCCALTDCAPNGCSALDTADECTASSYRCNGPSHVQACQATACSATWVDNETCPANKPFCVQTVAANSARGGSAECSASPSCSGTRGCASIGLCGDGPDGSCVPSAEGCANGVDSCVISGACGFANGDCAPTKEGCAAARVCATDGLCEVGADRCVASEAGCAASTACTMSGQCHAKDGSCSP